MSGTSEEVKFDKEAQEQGQNHELQEGTRHADKNEESQTPTTQEQVLLY